MNVVRTSFGDSAKEHQRLADEGDCEKGAEGGVAGSASIEAEHEFVEVALEMLSSQPVIDAERPGPGVGGGAVDPGQNDMRGHGADDMGLVPDVGGRRRRTASRRF